MVITMAQLEELYYALDAEAREYDPYEYGLPVLHLSHGEAMYKVMRQWAKDCFILEEPIDANTNTKTGTAGT